MASSSQLHCTLGGVEIKVEVEEENHLELEEEVVNAVVITVKTKLKVLKDKVSTIKSAIVSTDLKWEELFLVYKIRLDPTRYCISCPGGFIFTLGSQIHEYTRKTVANHHVVQLERITESTGFEPTRIDNQGTTDPIPTPHTLNSATTRDEINSGDSDPKRNKKRTHQCKYCSSKTRWTCESRCWGHINPYVCQYCNYPFTHKSTLKRHLEKSIICSEKANREQKYLYKVGDLYAKAICGFRVKDGIEFFLMQWHDQELKSWEPEQRLEACKPIIEQFRFDLKKSKGSK